MSFTDSGTCLNVTVDISPCRPYELGVPVDLGAATPHWAWHGVRLGFEHCVHATAPPRNSPGGCGDTAAALEYFEQMKQLDFVDAVSYNTVLKAHLGLWHFEEARALLREMSTRGLPANRVAFNEFLRALIAARDRRAVWSLVDDMRAAQVAPDSTTCSILLKSLTVRSYGTDVERTSPSLSGTSPMRS